LTSHGFRKEKSFLDADPRQWLKRCAAGDPRACAELVAQFGRMAGAIILRTLGRSQDVEDLVQETFLRVFRSLAEFEGRAKLSTWICTIAQRVAVDELRRRQRRPQTVAADFAMEAIDPADTERDTSQAQSDALVQEALSALPDKYRLPLVYSTIEGLDLESIASLLAIPVGTVKTNMFRGKQLLRQRLFPLFHAEGDSP
jgi:RNA polymerase sigma-70 factor, ECF subfamily